jgi:hypothetical protein
MQLLFILQNYNNVTVNNFSPNTILYSILVTVSKFSPNIILYSILQKKTLCTTSIFNHHVP